MQKTLYLDTARVGQMSSQAFAASLDFARFAHEQASTLYWTKFLQEGYSSWPEERQSQFPALATWEGVETFQTRLRTVAGANENSEVLLASRSTFLMQCAARLLTGRCRNVLITDCCWPAYARILREQCEQSPTRLSLCPLRQRILNERCCVDDVIAVVKKSFLVNQCDGLFLPYIDNLGIRLPVEKIVEEIQRVAELRFVVVDGAQTLGQVNPRLQQDYCDFFIAGSHKWLQGYYPLGIGYYGRSGSRSYITDSLKRWQQSSLLADPLLSFCGELTGATASRFGETVQLAPLLVANAAVCELRLRGDSWASHNRDTIASLAAVAGWNVIDIATEMQSQIVLLELLGSSVSSVQIRDLLQAHNIAVTVYKNGVVRLAMPHQLLTNPQLQRLARALAAAAETFLTGPANVVDEPQPRTPSILQNLTA